MSERVSEDRREKASGLPCQCSTAGQCSYAFLDNEKCYLLRIWGIGVWKSEERVIFNLTQR